MLLWLESKFFQQKGQSDLRGSMRSLNLGHDLRPLGSAVDVSHRAYLGEQNSWEGFLR